MHPRYFKDGGGCRNRTRVCRDLQHSLRLKRSALPLGQPSTNLAEADGVEPSSSLARYTSLRMRQACHMPNASMAEETGLEPVRAFASPVSGRVRYRSAHSSENSWQWERGLNPRIPHQDGLGLANRHITALSSHCAGRQGGGRTHRPLILSPRGMPIPVTCPHRSWYPEWDSRTHTVLFLRQTPPAGWAIRANLVQAEGLEPSMFSAWVGRVTADCRRRWATPA